MKLTLLLMTLTAAALAQSGGTGANWAQYGGTERHWATLIPELHDRGIAVKLLALAATGPFFDEVAARGVPATCLGLQRHTSPRALRRPIR